MGFMRISANFARVGGLPEDTVVNTFHFLTGTPVDDVVAAEVMAAIDGSFYGAFQAFMADTLSGTYVMKAYNLEDPEPRQPLHEETHTITTGSGSSLPAELAVCVSYRGDYESGEPNARRRGRIYIGPLDLDAVSATENSDVRVNTTFITALQGAAEALRDAVIADGHAWSVYSPTTDATETLADSFFPITQGWIDNAFDVQRRRGAFATTRNIWS